MLFCGVAECVRIRVTIRKGPCVGWVRLKQTAALLSKKKNEFAKHWERILLTIYDYLRVYYSDFFRQNQTNEAAHALYIHQNAMPTYLLSFLPNQRAPR